MRTPSTVADPILVVGEAAGQVKTTTGGAVYCGLLAAHIALEVLTRALAEDDLTAESLAEYDRRWRSLLGREIEVGVRFRQLARRVDDATLVFLIDLANRDGIKRPIESHRLFDWHAPLLSALLDGPLSLLRTLRLCVTFLVTRQKKRKTQVATRAWGLGILVTNWPAGPSPPG